METKPNSKNSFLNAWYKKGLKFKCLKCSKCCSGSPGYVWITQKDIESISSFLKITKKTFLDKYTRYISGRISLKENLFNFDCCFLKDKKCLIYRIRPKQFKQFPWWKDNLNSLQSWQSLKKQCPGIDNPEGKLFTFKEIQKKN